MPGIRLEPLAERHLPDLAELVADPDVLRFTRVPDPAPPGFPRSWLELYEAGRRDGTREAFAALDEEGRFAGLGLAFDIDREAAELELGYIVAPAARGRGVATEILRLLTRWALAEVGAQRVRLIVDVDNAASHRVAERCGYVREGVLRSLHLKQGVRMDAVLWSRLATDPEPPGASPSAGAPAHGRRDAGGRTGRATRSPSS
jgi:RimJ/RimL family protein N-acetyltransferase